MVCPSRYLLAAPADLDRNASFDVGDPVLDNQPRLANLIGQSFTLSARTRSYKDYYTSEALEIFSISFLPQRHAEHDRPEWLQHIRHSASVMSSRFSHSISHVTRFESLTVCHLILHLRQVHLADGPSSDDGPLRSSFLRFASNVVGNLGAPLDLDGEAGTEDLSPRSSANPLADGLADGVPGPLQEAGAVKYVMALALVLVDTES